MRKKLILIAITGILVAISALSYGQEADAAGRVLLLRKAQERKKTTVAVEAYLTGDILEVTIIARMYATKPKVYNAIIAGPGLGRMSPQERNTLYPRAEDEELLFLTEDMEGRFIRFSKKTEQKKAKGTLTKELVRFKIPVDKIKPRRRYQLRIKVESMQRSGQFESFEFDLGDLWQLVSR